MRDPTPFLLSFVLGVSCASAAWAQCELQAETTFSATELQLAPVDLGYSEIISDSIFDRRILQPFQAQASGLITTIEVGFLSELEDRGPLRVDIVNTDLDVLGTVDVPYATIAAGGLTQVIDFAPAGCLIEAGTTYGLVLRLGIPQGTPNAIPGYRVILMNNTSGKPNAWLSHSAGLAYDIDPVPGFNEHLHIRVVVEVQALCDADVTTTGENPGDPCWGKPDGIVDGADLSFFVEAWTGGDVSTADLTTTGANPGDPGWGVPDGFVDGADLSYFVEFWVGGCV